VQKHNIFASLGTTALPTFLIRCCLKTVTNLGLGHAAILLFPNFDVNNLSKNLFPVRKVFKRRNLLHHNLKLNESM